MAAQTKCLPLLPPVGPGPASGPLLDTGCLTREVCIEAAGDFMGSTLDIETSLTGEVWQVSFSVGAPGLYFLGNCSKWMRISIPAAVPPNLNVRFTVGGVVQDDCCDPCACQD